MARELTWGAGAQNVEHTESTVAKVVARYLHNWYKLLTGTYGGTGVWTVLGSSAAGTADGTDRWAAVTDMTDLTYSAGVRFPWILLRSPSGFLPNSAYCYILLSPGTGGSTAVECYMSTLEYPTGGTATALPTYTALSKRNSFNGVSSANFSFTIMENVTTKRRFHGMLSNNGDWVIMSSKASQTGFTHIAGMFRCHDGDNSVDTDVFPVFCFQHYNSAGTAGTVTNGGVGDTGSGVSGSLLRDGTSLGSSSVTLGIGASIACWSAGSNAGVNNVDGTIAKLPFFVFPMAANANSFKRLRGTPYDCYAALSVVNAANWSGTPAASPEYVFCGNPSNLSGGLILPYPTGYSPSNGA